VFSDYLVWDWFFVPVEGDRPVRGFVVVRRVQADTPDAAGRVAIDVLEKEERYRELSQTTDRELGTSDGCEVHMESVIELSWFRWYFSRQTEAFIFLQEV